MRFVRAPLSGTHRGKLETVHSRMHLLMFSPTRGTAGGHTRAFDSSSQPVGRDFDFI